MLTGEGINTQFTIPSPPCLLWHKLFPFLLQVKFYTPQGLNFCSVLQTNFPTTIHVMRRVCTPKDPLAIRLRKISTDVQAASQRGLAAERGKKRVRRILYILKDPDVGSGSVVHCFLSKEQCKFSFNQTMMLCSINLIHQVQLYNFSRHIFQVILSE